MRTIKLSVASVLGVGLCLALVTPAEAGSGRLPVAANTPIEIRLLSQIHSADARDGEAFSATLMNPIVVDGRTLVRKDARVTGRVVRAVSSGRLKQPAMLSLELTEVEGYSVRTEAVVLDGKSHGKRNAALIGGGTAAGAIIGAIAGGGKGAAIGALAGAAAGTAGAYMTGKQELLLPVETPLRFVTAQGGATAQAGQQEIRVHTPAERPVEPRKQARVTSEEPSVYVPPGRGAGASIYSIPEYERNVINSYLRNNANNLPPGLARRDRLPPGLERQLQRNGTLPPGLQRRVRPFPEDLHRQLAPVPQGYERVFLGNRVLVLDAQKRILDLFTVDF